MAEVCSEFKCWLNPEGDANTMKLLNNSVVHIRLENNSAGVSPLLYITCSACLEGIFIKQIKISTNYGVNVLPLNVYLGNELKNYFKVSCRVEKDSEVLVCVEAGIGLNTNVSQVKMTSKYFAQRRESPWVSSYLPSGFERRSSILF